MHVSYGNIHRNIMIDITYMNNDIYVIYIYIASISGTAPVGLRAHITKQSFELEEPPVRSPRSMESGGVTGRHLCGIS